MQPQIIKMSEKEYFAHPSINFTRIKEFEKYPEFFNKKIQSESTRIQELGQAIHAAILEPDEFHKKFQYNLEDLKTNLGKKKALEIREYCKIPLTSNDKVVIEGILNSIAKDKTILTLLKNIKPEMSIFWDDEITGLPLKGRLDAITEDDSIIDIKTTLSGEEKAFARTIANYKYNEQAAHYINGFERVTGRKCKSFYFIAIEKVSPFNIFVYRVDRNSRMITKGNEQIKTILNKLNDCIKSNQFESPVTKIVDIDMPDWAYNDFNNVSAKDSDFF